MANQRSLHRSRQVVGIRQQPRHANDLAVLNNVMDSLRLEHPYELDYLSRKALEREIAYLKGGQGPLARVPSAQYLYRLSGAKSVALSVTNLRLGTITADDNDDVIWSAFNDIAEANRWRRLTRYAAGDLIGRRDITWWTTLELTSGNIVSGSLQMGMYSTWLPTYALLLRCPLDYFILNKSALIPTCLDAFDQEVFHPTKYADNPTKGLAISLEKRGKLTTGSDEYVAGPIPVDRLEVLPVFVSAEMRKSCFPQEQGPTSWQLLEEYLSAL